jgi:thiamine biosynthesis lipoprotein
MIATRPAALLQVPVDVMGTVVSFAVRAGGGLAARDLWLALAEARIVLHRADAVFSTWKGESPISRLRRGEIDLGEAPAVVADVLERCRLARTLSRGWFDPWALPGGVDPTGLVKGWAAQQALAALTEAGVSAAMVNAGGDVVATGVRAVGQPWRIGIRDPGAGRDGPTSDGLAGVVEVPEPFGAVATSGIYERGQHVFDPSAGRFAARAVSATVTGPDLALADALATGLVAGGLDALDAVSQLAGYEAFLIGLDGSRDATEGFRCADVG